MYIRVATRRWLYLRALLNIKFMVWNTSNWHKAHSQQDKVADIADGRFTGPCCFSLSFPLPSAGTISALLCSCHAASNVCKPVEDHFL